MGLDAAGTLPGKLTPQPPFPQEKYFADRGELYLSLSRNRSTNGRPAVPKVVRT